MHRSSNPARGRMAVACALLAIAVIAAPPVAAKPVATPPNGIYTCAWTSAHPEEAIAAGVTCDPAIFAAAMAGEVASPSQASGRQMMMMSSGCQYVPSSGSVGQGVFAWGTYQYSTVWGWYGFNSPAHYTWYVQKSGAVTYVWNTETDTAVHSVGVPANIYRWGAQNHSSTAQRWDVCWNDN